MAAGLAALAGFVLFERRQRHPLLDPRLFSNRKLSAGSLSICIQFFAFFGFTFVSLQYLEGVRGYSPLVAALAVLPLSATMMPAARLTPRLASRFGARAVCVTGLVLVAVGLVIISRVGTDTSYLLMLAGLVPLGIGMGAAMTPATAAITEALPQAQQGVGSALNDLSREVGGALGTAVIGSIVTAVYRSSLQTPGRPGPPRRPGTGLLRRRHPRRWVNRCPRPRRLRQRHPRRAPLRSRRRDPRRHQRGRPAQERGQDSPTRPRGQPAAGDLRRGADDTRARSVSAFDGWTHPNRSVIKRLTWSQASWFKRCPTLSAPLPPLPRAPLS